MSLNTIQTWQYGQLGEGSGQNDELALPSSSLIIIIMVRRDMQKEQLKATCTIYASLTTTLYLVMLIFFVKFLSSVSS